jgi:antitoxin (DNA-binding transcriptional repressor) of toxin-antitoxin stability system
MVIDPGIQLKCMKEVVISEFKANCLAILEQVRKTRVPARVTRFGKPMAEVVPPAPKQRPRGLGSMAGTMKIVGDIVGPIGDWHDREAAR